MIISVPAADRYVPLIPCPWRHDLVNLKPPPIEGRRLELKQEVEWMQERWQIDFGTVTKHILYDLDTWYLQGIGLLDTSSFCRDETESAVQKLLKNGSQSLTAAESDLIITDHMLSGTGMTLEEMVKVAEEKKCEARSPFFYEAFQADPFHTRHLHKFPEGILQRLVVTTAASSTLMPNQFAVEYVSQRDYTELEQEIFQKIYELPAKS